MLSFLFNFHGRINRAQYWRGSLLLGFINFVASIVSTLLTASAGAEKTSADKLDALAGQSAIMLPAYAVLLWCGLAIQVKRFHDRGRTGWFSAAPFVAIVMLTCSIVGSAFANAPIDRLFNDAAPYFWLTLLVMLASFIDLACLPGVEGPNKYGDPPGSPRTMPQPTTSPAAVSAASSLFGAQSAMDRAIAERGRPTPAPQPQRAAAHSAPAPALAPLPAYGSAPASPTFGRRAPR